MFFAVNPPNHTLSAQIAQEFAELCADLGRTQPQNSLTLYALVDGAFDETFFNTRYPRTLPPRSLYADAASQALGLAAPHFAGCSRLDKRGAGMAGAVVLQNRWQAYAQFNRKRVEQ
jgi:hypothetical protein